MGKRLIKIFIAPLLVFVVFIGLMLGPTLQSTGNIYRASGTVEDIEIKQSGYVAKLKLNASKISFELRVPKQKSYLLPQIKVGDYVSISHLKPFLNKASVAEVTGRNLQIPLEEQIAIYKEDRFWHIIILLFLFGLGGFAIFCFLMHDYLAAKQKRIQT